MTSLQNDGVKSYRDLRVWKKGLELAKLIYSLTSSFPRHEIYGLSSQMRRAAVSVSANIAEGHARQHRNEYRQFVFHSLGSLAELDTMRIVALELQYIDGEGNSALEGMVADLQKMLTGLAASLINPE
jgi:four helix bundle protein